MSPTDILQLYSLNNENPNLFGIVISPRLAGVKVLCVRLTREGKDKVREFFQKAQEEKAEDPLEYIRQRISDSDTEFYCQIPFEIVDDPEPCEVVDLRQKEQVIGQLRAFILSGKADYDWLRR